MKTTKQQLVEKLTRKQKLEDERRRRWAELGDMDIMTVSEVATMLGMCSRTIYDLAMKQLIPGTKIGAQWRFSRKILTEFVQGRRDCHGEIRNGKELQPSRIPERSIGDSLTGGYQQGASVSYPSLENSGRVSCCQEKKPAA